MFTKNEFVNCNISLSRRSHQRCSTKKIVLKNFAIFIGKHLCWSLFLIKLMTWRPILKNTWERLLLSENYRSSMSVQTKIIPGNNFGISLRILNLNTVREFLTWDKLNAHNAGTNAMLFLFLSFLFDCYVDDPSLDHCWRCSLADPMLITEFILARPGGHLRPRNEVGSLGTAERPLRFEPGSFRLCIQRLNPLGHSPRSINYKYDYKLSKLQQLKRYLYLSMWLYLILIWNVFDLAKNMMNSKQRRI